MTTLLPVDITGFTVPEGERILAHAELTRAPVVNDYRQAIDIFAEIVNLGLREPTPPETADTVRQEAIDTITNGSITNTNSIFVGLSYPDAVTAAVQLIRDLATEGKVDPTDPVNPGRKHFLTIEMANAYNQLLVSLKGAGVDVEAVLNGTGTISTEQVLNWRNLAASSTVVTDILNLAISASGDQNRTLQALVELIYVKTGNELLTDNLEDLEEALDVTKTTLETLQDLQVLHNNLTAMAGNTLLENFPNLQDANDPTKFSTDFNNANNLTQALHAAADAQFNAIDPELRDNIREDDLIEFSKLINNLKTTIEALEVTTPKDENGNVADGTLLAKLREVQASIDAAINAAKTLDTPGITSISVNSSTLLGGAAPGAPPTVIPVTGDLTNSLSGILTATDFSLKLTTNGGVNELTFDTATVVSGTSPNRIFELNASNVLIRYDEANNQIIIPNDTNSFLPGQQPLTAFMPGGQPLTLTVEENLAANPNAPLNDPDIMRAALLRWTLDGYNESYEIPDIESGQIQREITAATTAAQSLNEEQKESVRRFLFVFEEYYKSAAAILSKITQLVERMAQAIAR